MDLLFITLVVVGIFACVAFIYLFILNVKKLYTYNEVQYTVPPVTSSLSHPVIYEVAYVSKNGNEWTFSKEYFDQGIKDMTYDFAQSRINYLIINSNLYKIEKVENSIVNKTTFTLTPSCMTEGSFTQCQIDTIVGNNAYTVLHIIGYWVA